jgi:hypothetical protein
MGVMRRATITVAAAVAACAGTACGGSSAGGTHPSARTGSDAGTAPATDQSAIRALTPGGAAGSTPISSPAYRKLIATAAGDRGLSPPIAAKVTDCIVKREAAQGYRTVADVASSPRTRQQAVHDAIECTATALPGR